MNDETSPNELQQVLEYYERNIEPYKYIFHCELGLTLEFTIEKNQLCHLLFGTIEKSISNRRNFYGETGYNAIKKGTIKKISDLPYKNRSHARNRIKYFYQIDKLLKNPKVIHYNQNIVRKGNDIKIGKSIIKANYLCTKILTEEKDFIIHLFLKISGKRLEPVSYFAQKDDSYIKDQLKIKVIKVEKVEKNKK